VIYACGHLGSGDLASGRLPRSTRGANPDTGGDDGSQGVALGFTVDATGCASSTSGMRWVAV